MKVIALDPGGTTGYAVGMVDDGLLLVVSGQIRYDHSGLWNALQRAAPQIVVTESFEYRRKSREGLDLTPVELIGVIKLYSEIFGVELHTQTASQAMQAFTDDMLKKDRLYKPARPHANDAVRHLLRWWQYGAGYQYNTRGYKAGA